MLKKYIITIILFSLKNFASADETYVNCVNKNLDWKWLRDSQNNYVKVVGYWKTQWLTPDHIFSYFELSDGLEGYNKLKEMCIKKFGEQFSILQPADHFYSLWHPFFVDNQYFVNGRISVYQFSSQDSLFLNNYSTFSNPNFEFLSLFQLGKMCEGVIDNCITE
ncbi:hypothetical protein ACWNT8_01285 [Pigmentibacter ruber]